MSRCRRRRAGFTIVELMVVVVIVMVIALMGMPALQNMLGRSRLTGSARETQVLMQLARYDAIKRGAQSGLAVLYAEDRVVAFADVDQDQTYTPGTDRDLGSYHLPNQIYFGATAIEDGDDNTLSGFYNDGATGGEIYFRSDGSVAFDPAEVVDAEEPFNGVAVRFKDPRGNVIEAFVGPPSTGKMALRKWNGGTITNQSSWRTADSGWTWQ